MKLKLLANDSLKSDDTYPIIIYVVLSGFIFSYVLSKLGTYQDDSGIWLYGVLTQTLLYVYCYKTLRKRNSYLIWLGVALIHFGVYLWIHNSIALKSQVGPGYATLRNTLPLLLMILLLRWISLGWQKKELVGFFHRYDKQISYVDRLLLAIYVFAMIALSTILR